MASTKKTKQKVKPSKRSVATNKQKKNAKSAKKTVKTAKAVKAVKNTKIPAAKKVTKKTTKQKKSAGAKTASAKATSAKSTSTKTTSAKATGAKSTSTKTTSAKTTKSKLSVAKTVVVKASKVKTVQKAPVKDSSKLPHFQSPTKEMLQLFRTAAKDKRKLLKEQSKITKAPNFLSKQDKKWKKYNMDLRIHSPARDSYFFSTAEDACTALVRLAKAKGLDVITVTDLYNMSHLEDLKKIAEVEGVRVIPGFEFICRLSTCDDLTFLALFPETYTSAQVDGVLTMLGIPSSLAAKINLRVELPLEQIIKIVESNEGVLIPTHIDKTPTRQQVVKILINNFGFHAFDLVYAEDVKFFQDGWPNGEFTFFTFSNSTSLAQIGNRNSSLRLPREGFAGLRDIIQRRAGDGYAPSYGAQIN